MVTRNKISVARVTTNELFSGSPAGLPSVVISHRTLCHLSKSSGSFIFCSHVGTSNCYCQSVSGLCYLYMTPVSSGLNIA